MKDKLLDYITVGHREVLGWVNPGALSAIYAFDRQQKLADIHGGIAEIGIHHGRLFLALALARRTNESAVAIDIFDMQEHNVDQSGKGNYNVFDQNLAKWDSKTRTHVLMRDSAKLAASEILANCPDGVRVFSVDGSHTAQYTENDIRLAEDTLVSHGICIVDDFYNAAWPGVQEGFYRYILSGSARLRPFAYGDNKLYLTTADAYNFYYDFVRRGLVPLAKLTKAVELGGTPCHLLQLAAPEVCLPALDLDEIEATSVSMPGMAAKVLPPEGWAAPEAWGVWSIGQRSTVRIPIPLRYAGQPGLHAVLSVGSLTAGNRPHQEATFLVNEERKLTVKLDQEPFSWVAIPIGQVSPDCQFVDVVIDCLYTQSLKDAGVSNDTRTLGVRLEKVGSGVLRSIGKWECRACT